MGGCMNKTSAQPNAITMTSKQDNQPKGPAGKKIYNENKSTTKKK